MTAQTFPGDTTGATDWRDSVGRTVRTDGCLIICCERGRAIVTAGMRRALFRRGDLLVLTSDVHLSVEAVSAGFAARYVSLSEAAIETAYYRIASQQLWDYLHFSPILRPEADERPLVAGWVAQAEWIVANLPVEARTTLLDNCAYNLLVAVDARLAAGGGALPPAPRDRGWAIICRFWSLLTRHAFSRRSVRFYAEALHITPDYLNKVCRRVYGMSPKALIDQQIAVEIKRLLRDTQLPVAEIASRLHFEDASYLCRFFRRCVGRSPLEFRRGTGPAGQ